MGVARALADGRVADRVAERSRRAGAGAGALAAAGAARQPRRAVVVGGALGAHARAPRVAARAAVALARGGVAARHAVRLGAATYTRAHFHARSAFTALVVRAVVVAVTLYCKKKNTHFILRLEKKLRNTTDI